MNCAPSSKASAYLHKRPGTPRRYGRNDVDNEVAESLNAANTYYTLLCYPSDTNFDGKFCKISVNLSGPGINEGPKTGLKAWTRDGYYALPSPPPPSDQQIAAELDRAIT